jgi:diaminohydroxyphosphoribosylaminopyrimidine deaminase/5-amino-6-(5-phosphoribosylamino)uracil reductase
VGPPLRSSPASGEAAAFARAAALAREARFDVLPNPPVGCVLVRGARVVGVGAHRAYGGPHAEVEALGDAGARARGATAYVTLEPCSTTAKTGPCVEALAAAGVAEVVWAERDPSERNGGRARAALADLGVRGRRGRSSAAARALLGEFSRATALSRPWVLLKWAMSLDGRTSPAKGRGGRLSGPEASAWLHDLRGRVEAVVVGSATVASDDPRLTARDASGAARARQPLRVVFDSRLSISPRAALVATATEAAPVLLACVRAPRAKRARLERPGVSVLEAGGRDGRVDPARVLRALFARGVRRVLLEGGGTLAGSFLRAGLVDQVACLATPLLLGGEDAPTPLSGTGISDFARAARLRDLSARALGPDVLLQALL